MIRRCLLLLACATLAPLLAAADLTVFAAASLSDALQEAARTYTAEGGDTGHFNFAASSTLARQLKEGAPADLFFSADEAKMDDLAQAGLIDPGTRRSLLSNTLVVIVPADAAVAAPAPDYPIRPAVRRLALAETRTVPAGIYARAWLEKMRWWETVAGKVVPVENVRACLAVVEAGNAEAGIVYRSDALLSPRVKIVHEVAAADGPPISYPLAVLKASPQPEAARRFAAFLATPAARAIFRRYGFIAAP